MKKQKLKMINDKEIFTTKIHNATNYINIFILLLINLNKTNKSITISTKN